MTSIASHPAPDSSAGRSGNTMMHIFFILFCWEIGLVLILLPWTLLWDNNFFFSLIPEWNLLWLSAYSRGAVSGVGLVNLWVGIVEAWRMWR